MKAPRRIAPTDTLLPQDERIRSTDARRNRRNLPLCNPILQNRNALAAPKPSRPDYRFSSDDGLSRHYLGINLIALPIQPIRAPGKHPSRTTSSAISPIVACALTGTRIAG